MLLGGVVKKFAKMGARVEIAPAQPRGGRMPAFSLDVRRDNQGELFIILIDPKQVDNAQVVDVRPKDRHLLLHVETDEGAKSKFLCGHDERHWFAASVRSSASNVEQAKQALKPGNVQESQRAAGVSHKERHKRHNKGFIRQGEWFFTPSHDIQVPAFMIIKKEPIQRGRGKPHICEELYRLGGVDVWVSSQYPNGITDVHYRQLIAKNPARVAQFRSGRRNAQVYVRGTVKHPDHKTVHLKGWHLVVPNSESANVTTGVVMAFID